MDLTNKFQREIKALRPPSFFKLQVSDIEKNFAKELDSTVQLYVMKNKGTESNYQTGLNNINTMNTSLLAVDSDVKKEIMACNKIIMELDSSIDALKNTADPDIVQDASSTRRVSDYSYNYKTKLYICMVRALLVLAIAYVLVNYVELYGYLMFFVTILVYIIVKWVLRYMQQKFSRYPKSSNKITVIHNTAPKTATTVDRSDTCMGKECCDETTAWVKGKGCVEIETM